MAQGEDTKYSDELIERGMVIALRDQFAMAALTGYVANPNFDRETAKGLGLACYVVADAMMEARKPK